MKHTARDYQAEDVDAIFRQWEKEKVRSTLYVAATGLGKTFVMTEVVDRMMPKRAILLAHRSELIWQARDAFLRRGIDVDVEKAELCASNNVFSRAPVVVATVQTLSSGEVEKKRMTRFNPKDFGLLLYDESHHSVSPSNKSIVDYFVSGNPDLRVLGVTATPDRADEEALGQIFESVAAERDILFGVENGWLVSPDQMMVHVEGLDFSAMRTTAGDLNGKDLSEAMESETTVQRVVQPTLESMFSLTPNTLSNIDTDEWGSYLSERGSNPRRTIVFTVSVRQAEILSNIFNRVLGGLSDWVEGKTPEDKRKDIFRKFDQGITSILVNCGVTTEGYDNPRVEIIVVARPTKSRSLYAQMIGRGTRVLPKLVDGLPTKEERLLAIANSEKPKMLVLDFVGNSGRHKLINTADILGGQVSDEAIERAAKKAKETKGPVNMRQMLDEEEKRIEQEKELRRQIQEAQKAKLVARVNYTSTKINPFDAFQIHPARDRGWDDVKHLTPKQTAMLLKQGINPDTMSYSQGRQLINEMFRRWSGKLATMKQCSLLKKHYHGLNTHELTMVNASKMIDALAKNGWKRPDFNGVLEGKQ